MLNKVVQVHCDGVSVRSFGYPFLLTSLRVATLGREHDCICLHQGDLQASIDDGVLVRIHSACITSETLGFDQCDCAWQLRHALNRVADEKRGIVIYLPDHEGMGHGLIAKMKCYQNMKKGVSFLDAYKVLGLPSDVRNYECVVTVLHHFGITKIRLLTNNPQKSECLHRAGIDVVMIPCVIDKPDPGVAAYLSLKKRLLGHKIEGY